MIEATNTLDSSIYDHGVVSHKTKVQRFHMQEVNPETSLSPDYLPSSTGGIGMAIESCNDREESI